MKRKRGMGMVKPHFQMVTHMKECMTVENDMDREFIGKCLFKTDNNLLLQFQNKVKTWFNTHNDIVSKNLVSTPMGTVLFCHLKLFLFQNLVSPQKYDFFGMSKDN